MKKLALVTMLLLGTATVAYADNPPTTQSQSAITPDSARKWAGVGKDIAEGISATAHGLNVEVNNFVTTPVGLISMFLLIWYMIGHTIFHSILGCIAWAALTSIMWKSFSIFHIPRIVVLPDSKIDTVYYKFNSNDAKTMSAFAHAAVFCAMTGVMLLIIF